MIEAFFTGLITSVMLGLTVALLVCAAHVIVPLIREQLQKFRRFKSLDKAVMLIGLAIAIAYGGSKSHVMNAGADDGIALVSVTAEYDSTNDVTAVEVSFIGNNVTTATPVSVRNAETETWSELAKIAATITTDLATNYLAFAVSGNAATNRFWWVGTETPAVIIETEGITITHFAASSTSVEIMWTCDDPSATEYTVQRRRKGETAWETVGTTSSLAYIYVGFTVGETWEWRVSSTYEGGE